MGHWFRNVNFSSCIDHLRRIRANQTGRSLVDITGDSDVFVYLHKYFVFLVKAGGQRVIECVLEGPPRVMASPQRSLSQSQEGSVDEGDRYEKALSTLDFQVITGTYLQGLEWLVNELWFYFSRGRPTIFPFSQTPI